MSKTIVIRNLKHVDHLEFSVPPPGVHILSGTNGSGKSCLLTCLLRIRRPNAFQTAFLTSKMSDALDVFNDAEITYTVNNQSVTYRYSGERWSPSPKSQSKLLDSFGYPSVIYAAANAERLEPRAEDFRPKNVREALREIKDAAKAILADEKFEQLKVVNVKRGVSAEAFLMPDESGRHRHKKKIAYYSEKNFSLGELCVLKLLRKLETCPHQSLVLIDELELALHPRAQVELLHYLEKVALQKSLTVLFSTHSANLIKNAKRENFYFIDRTDGKTEVIPKCYPTYALGHIASKDERSPDLVLYVEDDQARLLVEAIVSMLKRTELEGKSKPTVVVAPIGTFSSVVGFLSRSGSLLPDGVKQYAVLDADAKTDYLDPLIAGDNHKELAKWQAVEANIRYLPWTPEVGICNLILSKKSKHESGLRNYFDDSRISLDHVNHSSFQGLSGGKLRKAAKAAMASVISEISSLTLKSQERIREGISDYFVAECLSGPDSALLKALFLPLIKH